MFVRLVGLWPPMAVMLDVAVPIASKAFSWGFAAAVYLSLAIVAAEGLGLRWLDRAQRWRAIWIAAVAMNVASIMVGLALPRYGWSLMDRLGLWLGGIRGLSNYGFAESLSDPGALVDWFAAFAFLWLVTTLIEAVVLVVVRRDGRPWRSLGHSAAVNAVSYVPLAVGLLLFAEWTW